MKKAEKDQFIAWMRTQLETAPSVVVAHYRGLTVAQMSDLRARCREAGVQVKVVKNTLLRRAAAGTPLEHVVEHLDGPTALAWHLEDPGSPARILVEFSKQKTNESLQIRGGAVSGKSLSADHVKSVLATLPTRPELLGTMAGLVAAGPTNLARVLSAGPNMLGRVIGALKEQRESAGG